MAAVTGAPADADEAVQEAFVRALGLTGRRIFVRLVQDEASPVSAHAQTDSRAVGPAPDGFGFLADGDSSLWADGNRVSGSADGGRTWKTWRLDPKRDWSSDDHDSDAAGGAAWFTLGPNVYVATGGGRPVRTPAQPPRLNNIYEVAAIDADHAVVMGAASDTSSSRWYETSDRGVHWSEVPDPCAGTPGAGSIFSVLSVAPDGTRWAVCTETPELLRGGGSQSPDPRPSLPTWRRRLQISTDGGRTWNDHGGLNVPGSGLGIYLRAMSAHVSWLHPFGGDCFRRAGDALTRFADVAKSGGYIWQFLAVDSTTAVYVDATKPLINVTRDGGGTVTAYRLPINP